MTLHIFLISRCLAENFIWEQSYLLFSFQKQDSQARSCHSLSPVFLLSEGAWFGSQLPLKSRGARSTLRSHSGPSWGWTIIFKGYSDNLNAPETKLQSHFKQRCSECHCTRLPADFNRCPTFKRDHYQHSTTPVVTTLILKSASLSRCCPCCAGMTLYHWPVNETSPTDRTYQTLFPWCTLRSAFLLQLPLRNRTDRI